MNKAQDNRKRIFNLLKRRKKPVTARDMADTLNILEANEVTGALRSMLSKGDIQECGKIPVKLDMGEYGKPTRMVKTYTTISETLSDYSRKSTKTPHQEVKDALFLWHTESDTKILIEILAAIKSQLPEPMHPLLQRLLK